MKGCSQRSKRAHAQQVAILPQLTSICWLVFFCSSASSCRFSNIFRSSCISCMRRLSAGDRAKKGEIGKRRSQGQEGRGRKPASPLPGADMADIAFLTKGIARHGRRKRLDLDAISITRPARLLISADLPLEP